MVPIQPFRGRGGGEESTFPTEVVMPVEKKMAWNYLSRICVDHSRELQKAAL